jgi:hypothetical protein
MELGRAGVLFRYFRISKFQNFERMRYALIRSISRGIASL